MTPNSRTKNASSFSSTFLRAYRGHAAYTKQYKKDEGDNLNQLHNKNRRGKAALVSRNTYGENDQ